MSRNYEEFKEFKLRFECYDSNLRINAFFFFKEGYRSPGVDMPKDWAPYHWPM
jgi:hypothetical protein